jgi:UDP:flavonoid glycosyltransferase YjiC (YdhE family)
MATILLTWELGGGMGHLANLAPLARGLAERGHRVTAALSDLSRAHRAFAGVPVAFFQAPHRLRTRDRPESNAGKLPVTQYLIPAAVSYGSAFFFPTAMA